MSPVESSFGHITALNLINGPNEGVALLMKLERALLGGECCERNETHLASIVLSVHRTTWHAHGPRLKYGRDRSC